MAKYIASYYLFPIICLLIGCAADLHSTQQLPKRRFLFKTELDTSAHSFGQHIEIKQILPETDEMLPMSIDDRDIIGRSGYTRADKIVILGEYLTYRGDTTTSNKRYQFKAAYWMLPPEGIEGFTIEIEALYSFTRMLTKGLPPIRPMLIHRETGEPLNRDPKVVREVYEIYTEWYQQNSKTDFQDIDLPLSGTPYTWLGEDKGMKPFLLKSL